MKASKRMEVQTPVAKVTAKEGSSSGEDMPAKEPHIAAWPRPGAIRLAAKVTAAEARTGLAHMAWWDVWE
jgi:hypothetical protein